MTTLTEYKASLQRNLIMNKFLVLVTTSVFLLCIVTSITKINSGINQDDLLYIIGLTILSGILLLCSRLSLYCKKIRNYHLINTFIEIGPFTIIGTLDGLESYFNLKCELLVECIEIGNLHKIKCNADGTVENSIFAEKDVL